MRHLFISALAALCALASPAGAAQVIVTYSGKVLSGTQNNVFGSGTSDLAGKDFSLKFSAAIPTTGMTVISFPGHDEVFGSDAASPIRSATITLDGATVSWAPGGLAGAFSQMVREDEVGSPAIDWIYAYLFAFGDNFQSYTYAIADLFTYVNEIMDDPDFFLPVDYATSPGDAGVAGVFSTETRDTNGNLVAAAFLDLRFSRVTAFSLPDAVPEPASWAYMIGGFGVIGGALRSRQRSAKIRVRPV